MQKDLEYWMFYNERWNFPITNDPESIEVTKYRMRDIRENPLKKFKYKEMITCLIPSEILELWFSNEIYYIFQKVKIWNINQKKIKSFRRLIKLTSLKCPMLPVEL